MGQLIVEQIVSADGYAQDESGGIDFFESERSANDADAEQLRVLESVGAIVFGRRTYQLFESFWSTMDSDQEPVAEPINRLPKYVISNALTEAPWGPDGGRIEILRGDGVEAVEALKRRVDGDLIVWGSLTLADSLLKAGAVDTLRLRYLPKLLGTGRSFAPRDLGVLSLALRKVQSYRDGFVVIEYAVGGAPRR